MTRPTKFSIWLTATVISAVGVGAAGVAVVVSMLSPLNFANLSDFEGGGYVAALVGYSDHTDTVCRGVWGCEQGYSSASAEFRKFDFVWNANAFAESHSNTYQRGVVVIEYTSSALSEHDRQGLQSIFDNVGKSDDPPQGVAKVLRAGKSAERFLEPFSRLSDEFNFLVDVYEKVKELAGIG